MDNWGKVDAKDIFQEAIHALELQDKISNLVVKAGREVYENDLATLTRIIDEHAQFISLLNDDESYGYGSHKEIFNRAIKKLTMYKTIVKLPNK